MALQIMTSINVDFYDEKYILINAKQYDSGSRWILISCYNQGKFFNLRPSEHFACIKYRKADGHEVFNFCQINYKGEVLVELTEQMLAVNGICSVDLVIINKGNAMVNPETGEIIDINEAPILSTMTFYINVHETNFNCPEIESSYEFNALNELLQIAGAEYKEVILTSKSYAVGGTETRYGEDFDNAKYYCEQSLLNANNAAVSEKNALISEGKAMASELSANESEINAKASERYAKTSETNAKTSETNAKTYELSALNSKEAAATSEANAKKSETNAFTSETNTKKSESNAANSASAANASEQNAKISEVNAKESEEKANNYCELVKSVADGLNSGFIPIGTISFSELATAEKATGFTYNINEDFITDETFVEGSGKSYAAGTNVYCRFDGLWDCFGGAASPTATIDEVKSYLNI